MKGFVISRLALLAAISVGLFGCFGGVDKEAADTVASPNTSLNEEPGRHGPFDARLLEISQTYQSYKPADMAMRLGGFVCDFTPTRFLSGLTPAKTFTPDTAVSSRKEARSMQLSSGDPGTHGKKLYLLFSIYRLPRQDARPAVEYPVGQAVVKEAWIPEEVRDDGKPLAAVSRKVKVHREESDEDREDSFVPYVRSGGRLYHAKERAGLFIMFKVEPDTPGTDEGWVYGTVSADGQEVKSAGKVQSCMKCHQGAPHDRLFGLPERN